MTVNSRNLNGDVDVFTAGTLRPLLKLSLYAESSSPVTKGIYLRKREGALSEMVSASADAVKFGEMAIAAATAAPGAATPGSPGTSLRAGLEGFRALCQGSPC